MLAALAIAGCGGKSESSAQHRANELVPSYLKHAEEADKHEAKEANTALKERKEREHREEAQQALEEKRREEGD
jgi:hypothetical protein